MKAIAINGSPRKKWNTATLLERCLEGARAEGAEGSLAHLYDYAYKGCISCFECKKIGGKSYGRCAVRDELTPLFQEIETCDVLILGSPVYFGAESGEMRSFLERLLFPFITYTPSRETIFPRNVRAAMVYTMNVSQEALPKLRYEVGMERARETLTRVFGSCELLLCADTLQFNDYSKYLSTLWDAEAKARRRAEIFPQECEQAFELGRRLTREAQSHKQPRP